MKRDFVINLLITFLCSFFINAVAEEPHVHGDVNLNIVKENSLLEVVLISPAVNIVGFEHPASNAEEWSTVEKANTLLAQPEKMFFFHNQCCKHLETSMVQSGPVGIKNDEPDHAGHHHKHDKNDHSDFEMLYKYICVKEVNSLSVNLKDYFSGVSQIKVKWIKDGVQGGVTLTAAKREIIF